MEFVAIIFIHIIFILKFVHIFLYLMVYNHIKETT